MFMSLADLRAMPHLSVSQLKTFLSCPKKFYFQYIEKAEPAFRPVALAFGTAWHAVIGHHLTHSTREQPVPREELRDLLRRELEAEVMRDGIPILFDGEEADLGSSIDLGIACLMHSSTRSPPPDEVLGVELAFVLELAHPVTGEIASLPFIGAIDALVIRGRHAGSLGSENRQEEMARGPARIRPPDHCLQHGCARAGARRPRSQTARHYQDEDARRAGRTARASSRR